MAEQTLSDLVMNLISWIESLHEKNLKYEAQVETLSRDLAKAQNSNEELEARLSAYQNNNSVNAAAPVVAPINTQIHQQHQHQHQQTIYQPIGNPQTFAPQPAPYMWTYDPSAPSYYDQYENQAFHQQQ